MRRDANLTTGNEQSPSILSQRSSTDDAWLSERFDGDTRIGAVAVSRRFQLSDESRVLGSDASSLKANVAALARSDEELVAIRTNHELEDLLIGLQQESHRHRVTAS